MPWILFAAAAGSHGGDDVMGYLYIALAIWMFLFMALAIIPSPVARWIDHAACDLAVWKVFVFVLPGWFALIGLTAVLLAHA